MNRILVIAICVVSIACHSSSCCGDLLWLKNSDKPASGLLKSRGQNGNTVWLLNTDAKTPPREITFAAEEIRKVVLTIDIGRMERLSTSELKDYRDYAEELIAADSDPYARQTAKRLLLICVYHGFHQDNLEVVSSALKNLIYTAENDNEKAEFEGLTRLYVNNANELLSTQTPSKFTPSEGNRKQALLLLQAMRKSEFSAAAKVMNAQEFNSDMLPKLLVDAIENSIQNQSLENDLKMEILRWELHLRFQSDSNGKRSGSQLRQLTNSSTGKLRFKSVEAITEFDLKATRFLNGSWQRPASN